MKPRTEAQPAGTQFPDKPDKRPRRQEPLRQPQRKRPVPKHRDYQPGVTQQESTSQGSE